MKMLLGFIVPIHFLNKYLIFFYQIAPPPPVIFNFFHNSGSNKINNIALNLLTGLLRILGEKKRKEV